ncbi:hypothetical protein PHMEG_00038328 [Phytophthora megakarya]|uniref:Reverse transcriptase RNase H-like domain-containing protein n=1 Tax=Phytophthora megakarya TaxID=4795 RepID=A0A225UHN8_9STRA|nr:hypothetical protein PHMEG_00038328 [Phytophthora megakarya]
MEFPDPNAELLLFTDASATGYSIIVTPVRQWDALIPVDEQKHELIVCKGGMFTHAELNWTVVEKEAFPIVKACHDLDYLLLRPNGFRLYCDHANLAYIFAPGVELKKHVSLQRWAMRLCGLHYTIEHIPGEKNAWATSSLAGIHATLSMSPQYRPEVTKLPQWKLCLDFALLTTVDLFFLHVATF